MKGGRGAVSLALAAVLTGCAAAPTHYPSETAQKYVGKPLFALEMHWSVPSHISAHRGRRRATWRFDQYNLSGCRVSVDTDAHGIIRAVSWTEGCGPKSTKGER